MAAWYNENDLFAAEWLRNLIAAGHIAPGEVDTRSIEDVSPDDLRGFQQCHFFAGIGVWSYSLRHAGWPDDRVAWTGSCPCQPFSAAGKRGGTADERHLWPAFFHLIEECHPPVVFGEQVASKDGLAWLDLVSADMEGAGYAFGASDLCAAGVGAPHIRQRLYFVGVADDDDDAGLEGRRQPGRERAAERLAGPGGLASGVYDAAGTRQLAERIGAEGEARDEGRRQCASRPESETGGLADDDKQQRNRLGDAGPGGRQQPSDERTACGLEHDPRDRRIEGRPESSGRSAAVRRCEVPERSGPTNGFWRDADWLLCRDERWRPVGPGTFPLVNGAPARVGRLRAYGNALVAETASCFVGAVMDALGSS